MAPAKRDFVVIGKVTGVWGVRGWLKLESYTEQHEDIFDYQPWVLVRDGRETQVSLVEGKRHGGGLVVQLQGIEDRDHAAQWIGYHIAVAREQLPELPAGEYYWRQLTGLEVVTDTGVVLGKVTSLLATGANDVLVVMGERERLIPYLPQVVSVVDLAQDRIVVDWDPEF